VPPRYQTFFKPREQLLRAVSGEPFNAEMLSIDSLIIAAGAALKA